MMQEFAQQVEETAKAAITEIHTALPGEIVSFNPGSGTATVKPVGRYVTPDGAQLSYPNITEVPVVFPFCQTSGIGMVFPVKPKDSCMIIISEVELDEWRSGAKSNASLRFDLTSAMCIPGLLEGGSDLTKEANSKNAAVIAAGDTKLVVSGNGVLADTGDTQFEVTDAGVSIVGNVKVKGTLTCTDEITAGEIKLTDHVHVSAAPGEDTEKPK